jgi:hypothetical protein
MEWMKGSLLGLIFVHEAGGCKFLRNFSELVFDYTEDTRR